MRLLPHNKSFCEITHTMLESLIPSRLGLNQGIYFTEETRELVKILSGKAFFSRLSEKQKMEKLARSEVKGDMEEKWIEA